MSKSRGLPGGVTLVATLAGHDGPVGQLAWTPDGRALASASADGTVRLWDAGSWSCRRVFEAHEGGARGAAFDAAGQRLATAGMDDHVRLWDPDTGTQLRSWKTRHPQHLTFGGAQILAAAGFDGATLWDVGTGELLERFATEGRYATDVLLSPDRDRIVIAGYESAVTVWSRAEHARIATYRGVESRGVAMHPSGDRFLIGGDDGLITLCEAVPDGRELATWEGHATGVREVGYSHDGRFAASKAYDEVRIWDAEDGACVARIPIASEARWSLGLAFHPSGYRLAVVGSPLGVQYERPVDGDVSERADRLIHVFDLQPTLLSDRSSSELRYASAKVMLVGDSGVGKTGLGWRLAHGMFQPHESTHGQQFWTLDQLRHVRADGAEGEVVLWDLAGQPDYRLVHALFLDDADVALVLFDPTEDDPLRGVEYWLRQVRGRAIILVAARIDRGTSHLTDVELAAFCAQRDISAYVATSARTGAGLTELIDAVRASIPWDRKPATVTTATFKRIKDRVLSLRERTGSRVIVSPGELRERLRADPGIAPFSDAEMLTAVGHLSNHGYVSRLTTSSGETRILLAPELLNNVAASIVLQARRNPRSLGALDEERLLANDYGFRELDDLEPVDRDVLLDSAVAMFLAHNVCFRDTDASASRTYLIFPDLINVRKRAGEEVRELEDGASYTVVGAVENVYASLVVLLGYTSVFTRSTQWRDQAEYLASDESVCGIRLERDLAGQLDLVLYYGVEVSDSVRGIFQGLVETFLDRRNLAVRRYRPIVCPNGHRLNRAVVREFIDAGQSTAFCTRCGVPIDLSGVGASAETPKKLAGEHQIADERARFEQVLFRLRTHVAQQRIKPLDCFISYARGHAQQDRWVERLAEDLLKAGFTVILDQWDLAIGASMQRFTERALHADRVLVLGTPAYRRVYDPHNALYGVIVDRCRGTASAKQSVLPLLLEGDDGVFPPLLRSRVYADFRETRRYFSTLLTLLLSLYELDPRDRVSVELRALLGAESGA